MPSLGRGAPRERTPSRDRAVSARSDATAGARRLSSRRARIFPRLPSRKRRVRSRIAGRPSRAARPGARRRVRAPHGSRTAARGELLARRWSASRQSNRRRPTLPGPCGPSTIGAEGLNCSVRNGKRCFPLAKTTGKRERPRLPGPSKLHRAPRHEHRQKNRQALDPLVPVSFERCRPSRSGLSTWWSTRGLTPSRGWESSS
jgi:hypothetical protein